MNAIRPFNCHHNIPFLTIFMLIQSINTVSSFDLICDYEKLNNSLWGDEKNINTCIVRNKINVTTNDDRTADKIIGGVENNVDVHGFKVIYGYWLYFPQNLNIFFPFLHLVELNAVKLKELHQSDLVPLTALKFLHLNGNEIEYIERDLFIYNQNIEVIILKGNKIVNIDTDVFDYLTNLRYLNLENNLCISNFEDEKVEIKNFISQVKEKCGNCDFRLQKNLSNELRHARTVAESLRIENEILKAQNVRSAEINFNLTTELDNLKLKVAQKHSKTQSRVLLLTIMLTIMCVLSIVFAIIIIWFILHIRTQRNIKCSQVIEYSKRNDEHIVVRQQQQKTFKIENVYEDIRGNSIRSEPDYDKLNHY